MLQLALSSESIIMAKHYTEKAPWSGNSRVTSTLAKHHSSLCGTMSTAACKHLSSGHRLPIKPFLGTGRKRSADVETKVFCPFHLHVIPFGWQSYWWDHASLRSVTSSNCSHPHIPWFLREGSQDPPRY